LSISGEGDEVYNVFATRYLGLLHLRTKNIEAPLTTNEAIGLLDMMFMFDDAATYQVNS
jgi:hypothetical protein